MAPRLFVNVDHVATVRQARRTVRPDPVEAALLCLSTGKVAGITVHLREDRRHVNDDDVARMKSALTVPFNLEMSCAEQIVGVCLRTHPEEATLVPEKREEVTTEGGLDMRRGFNRVREVTRRLRADGILVSLFIDPDAVAVKLAADAGASHVELHTGRYCDAPPEARTHELEALHDAALVAHRLGLVVNAGHGLSTENVGAVAAIPNMHDLNIGHSIIARAVMVGLVRAVDEIHAAMQVAPRD